MKELQLRNRQRGRAIDTGFLRTVTASLLDDLLRLPSYQLALHLVSARRMARLNGQFLRHAGPTDVITFDLRRGFGLPRGLRLAGEIYICVSEAERQAEEFGVTWREEVIRYAVHGVLHLSGYDDVTPAKRRAMKREEDRLMGALARRFTLAGAEE